MPTQFQVQYNWQNQGFTEIYYNSAADYTTARAKLKAFVVALQTMMPKNGPSIWGVRITVLGVFPVQEQFIRQGALGTYQPAQMEVSASPWDAFLYYASTGLGQKKVQEKRMIPTTLVGIVGNVPIPGSQWLDNLTAFWATISGLGFGFYHSVKPNPNAMANVQGITVSPGVPNGPSQGNLVVQCDASPVTALNSPAKVVFNNTRCTPKLAPRHIGIFIDGTHFYLKGTNEGVINYQGGGKCYIYNPQVATVQVVIPMRSAVRKVGRAFGTQKGRNLHRV